jgi:HAE1 family hydrophobic/amphiphilic exporter-1
MWITRTSVNQPVFATMVMLALVVLGLVSYRLLPVEQMPEVSPPEVFIYVQYPGASPEAVEADVIKPIENVVNSIPGIKDIFATAREGSANISVQFQTDVDIVAATQEIRDKVAQVKPWMPRDVRDPQITRASTDGSQEPVVTLTVYSTTRSMREVSTIVEQQIVKRLENTYGVGHIWTGGSVERQVQIFLRPDALQSYRIGVDQVVSAIQSANQDLPAGIITHGASDRLVRVEGKIKDPAAFGRIIVANQGGAPVYLNQVAEIVDGEAEETSISRTDGRPSVSIYVYRMQQSNIVQTGKAIEEAVKELRERLPEDIQIATVWSDAEWIEASLDRVKRTIIEGAVLTVLIVFLFLHSWRSTIITALTLPISVIATFIVLHFFGFTLNFMTLMALSLCIGLLIDDAIVVRENIVRHADMGKSHRQAALDGTEEIGLAVMATTFAILAVFVPVAFMSGTIGKFFLQFGITVSVAVAVSLFVSFTLDPMLSSVWPDPKEGRFKRAPWLARIMERVEDGVEAAHRWYDRMLRWTLSGRRYGIPGLARWARRRASDVAAPLPRWASLSPRSLVLLVAAFSFFGGFLLVPKIGVEFVPQSDDGFVFLRVNTPIGSSLEYTDAKVRDVEAMLRQVEGVQTVLTSVGTNEGRNHARLFIRLTDPNEHPRRPQSEIEREIRERVNRMAGLTAKIGWQPVNISVLGPDNAKLTELSQELMKRLATVPGIVDLESSEKGATPTIAVRINNELASELGITTAHIGNALRPLIAGDEISTWVGPDGQDYDVIVRLPREQRELVTDLGDLYLTSSRLDETGNPVLVPLRQVAELVYAETPEQIRRQNMQRRISIFANAEGRPTGDVGADAEKVARAFEKELPQGYRIEIGGEQQNMSELSQSALVALSLAVLFIYFVLASQFGSFVQPIAIMVSLPLSLIGVLLALLLTGTTLNLFSIIGFIMLMGLVTKNAILLVDFTNQALREGKSLHEAILEAGQVRLRPIVMTTMAMIFGMLPMSIGAGTGGELLAPMGRAVIGGVITSTLLTLLVVPVLYTYIYGLTQRVKARRRKHAQAGEHAAQPAAQDEVQPVLPPADGVLTRIPRPSQET